MKRDPFARLKEETGRVTVSDLIPMATPRKRKREWERQHRGRTYRIPAVLVDRARAVRQDIVALAQEHMTTASDVAEALLSHAIRQINANALSLQFSPPVDRRRKMSVRVVTGSAPEIPEATPKSRCKQQDFWLDYRLPGEVDASIRAIAGGSASSGEVLVLLLEAALEALKSGRIRLQSEPEVVRQRVSAW